MEATIVYKKGGKHRGPKGIPFSYKGVKTEEELLTALKDGWYETLPEAIEPPKPRVQRKPKAPVKNELD